MMRCLNYFAKRRRKHACNHRGATHYRHRGLICLDFSSFEFKSSSSGLASVSKNPEQMVTENDALLFSGNPSPLTSSVCLSFVSTHSLFGPHFFARNRRVFCDAISPRGVWYQGIHFNSIKHWFQQLFLFVSVTTVWQV